MFLQELPPLLPTFPGPECVPYMKLYVLLSKHRQHIDMYGNRDIALNFVSLFNILPLLRAALFMLPGIGKDIAEDRKHQGKFLDQLLEIE
jgi:hypothetical protein